jgi:DNA-binding winged helix-turn-helix (wHTH) protein/tetratricopeptide (TPR) repeat protein
MEKKLNALYEFGPFRLDPNERLLRRDSQVVPLTPKAFDLLLVLLEHPGRLLEKETLLETVWPDSIVEEGNLADNISRLRKALGEGENGQKFIETIPRRGYRFVADVRRSPKETPTAEEAIVPADVISIPPSAPNTLRSFTPNRRSASLIALAVILLFAIGAWIYRTRQPVLTDKDTILLADFENKTGDEVFDDTLKQGLAIQLQNSPFLKVFSAEQVRQTLRLMQRSPDERVTAQLAREICERENIKALVAGSIAPLGNHYVITLEAINGQSGESLARAQVEAEGKEQALSALARAATGLRQQLGESLSSIRQHDRNFEDATTHNLEAFKSYARGADMAVRGRMLEAIPLLQRAVELDPDFAYAWSLLSLSYTSTGRLELAAECAAKAYALRERVNEYERLAIDNFYHGSVTGNIDKRIEVLNVLNQTYPPVWSVLGGLAANYNQIGQSEKAIAVAPEAIRLNPKFALPRLALGQALMRLNRYGEAKDVFEQALAQQIERTEFHALLYQLAFIEGDAAGLRRQLDWAGGKPEEYSALDWQSQTAAFGGEWRKAQDFARRAIDLAARGDTVEVAARYAAEQALRGAIFGDCSQAKSNAAHGLKLARGRASLPRAALALALCGEVNQAQPLAEEIGKRYPEDTLLNSIWLPIIHAALELQRGNAARALEQLQASSRYEAAAEFWQQHLRGRAHLKLGRGAEAAAEFQKILDQHGFAPLSPLYPLAHLDVARAAALTGDTARSRKSYAEFFAAWKYADADLPILREAKSEHGLTAK